MKFLSGWKTYLVAVIGIAFNGLVAAGYVDEGLRETLNSLLGFLGLATMREAVAKVETTTVKTEKAVAKVADSTETTESIVKKELS